MEQREKEINNAPANVIQEYYDYISKDWLITVEHVGEMVRVSPRLTSGLEFKP